jgi:hypothetical protein
LITVFESRLNKSSRNRNTQHHKRALLSQSSSLVLMFIPQYLGRFWKIFFYIFKGKRKIDIIPKIMESSRIKY